MNVPLKANRRPPSLRISKQWQDFPLQLLLAGLPYRLMAQRLQGNFLASLQPLNMN